MKKAIKAMLIVLTTMGVQAGESTNNGFIERQHIFGDVYCINQKDTQDYKQAACYRHAAELGDAIAQYNLGVIYNNGEGVKRDFKQAFVWFRKAAEQGHSESQLAIGDMYLLGQGVVKDNNLALDWRLKAAERGNFSAQVRLAFMYDFGIGVAQNYEQAAAWHLKVVERSSKGVFKDPQYFMSTKRLSEMFYHGQWVPKNKRQVVAWIREHAQLGDEESQYHLGMLHYIGNGVLQDEHMAAMWFRQAAEQGHSEAQYWLGMMYMSDTVLPRDYIQAYIWFSLSETNGSGHASSFRENAADKLTAAARSEAQTLIISYLKKHSSKS